MNIPGDLKIYSFIYEYYHWVLLPLIAFWIAGGIYLVVRVKKAFFLWLLIFPLVLSPFQIACIYSGWHYRMELRERFGKDSHGWCNINCMPPVIRAEYAKHNYHPRFRDIKAHVAGTIVLTPILYALGGLAFLISAGLRKFFEKQEKKVE